MALDPFTERTGRVTRRSFLRGAAGAALALPFLESWPFAREARGEPEKAPLRFVFIMVPNGVNLKEWRPTAEGPDFVLPKTLEPLAKHREDLLVLSGLGIDGAAPNGDGAGDHARAGAAFLTCSHPRKTGGADIHAGVSVDQLLARVLGESVPFASVELGTEASAQGGSCDSGYSCAYSSNLAWSSPSSPLSKEIDPKRAFDRLFCDGDGLLPAQRAKRDRYRASILDAVSDDAKKARDQMSGSDRRKLDEYLDSVRTLEKRFAATGRQRKGDGLALQAPPAGVPSDYKEHIRRLHDVVTLAFETDTTRVVSIMLGNEGSNRSYPSVEAPEGHHDLSHHGKDQDKLAKVARIDRFHVEQLAYLCDRLAATKEGNGTLLESTIIFYGSAIADGDAHNHDDLPLLLLGGRRFGVDTGRHARWRHGTPAANLYLSLLQKAGVKADRFADSTAPLAIWR
jgi:hypothetical protein